MFLKQHPRKSFVSKIGYIIIDVLYCLVNKTKNDNQLYYLVLFKKNFLSRSTILFVNSFFSFPYIIVNFVYESVVPAGFGNFLCIKLTMGSFQSARDFFEKVYQISLHIAIGQMFTRRVDLPSTALVLPSTLCFTSNSTKNSFFCRALELNSRRLFFY